MAEKKNPVEAAIFKQTPNTNYEVDRKTEKKFARVVPRELRFSRSTPNPNPKFLNPMEITGRIMRPSRMLIYEDSSDEEEAFRSTPPNIQDRKMGTPGAPMKSRKDFEKKVLRPKKLVYNEKGNDHQPEDLDKENQYYQMTPKKSEKNEDNGDFYYEKFLNITAIVPRKIIPISDDDSRSVYATNRQLSVASTSNRSIQQDNNKSRNEGSRKKNGFNASRKSSKLTIPKNDLDCNKENNAVQFKMERDREVGESSKQRSFKSDRNREDFTSLSKTGELLTHFRI